MMGYLDRLKGMDSEKCPPLPLQELQKAPFDSFCSSHGARFQKITPLARPADDAATASRWWLLHYPDREPVEVAFFPPATHAEILERHPEAIAAEPSNLIKPDIVRACSTCTHATYRGGCGEPVLSGLSDVVGVICYSPDQGATCPAWLAIIPGDLEARILAMAEHWNYSGDDLAAALSGARSDPDGWQKVAETDESERGE
jgi:hypothetical protein